MRKDEGFKVRCSAADHDQARALAEAEGVGLSELVRSLLRERRATTLGVSEAVRELSRRGGHAEPGDLAARLTLEAGRLVRVDEVARLAEAREDVEPFRGGFRPRATKRRAKR